MKKLMSRIMVLVMICSLFLTPFAVFAADTVAGGGTIDEIEKEIQYDFIPDDLLQDDQKHITREEFCQVLMELYDYLTGPVANATKLDNRFTDTDNLAVIRAYNLGIISKAADGKFRPHDELTIEEKAVMLYETLKKIDPNIEKETSKLNAGDADEISPWALEAITYLNAHKILITDQNNEINPRDNITKEKSHDISRLAAQHQEGATNYLTLGYHVIDNGYIDPAKVNKRAPILDEAKLDKTDYEQSSDHRSSDITDIVATKASSIYSQLNASAKVSYKGVLYSGSIKSDYSLGKSMSANEVLVKHIEYQTISEKYLNCDNEELKDLLSGQFVKDLKNLDPDDIFNKYGTHLITRYSLGGRIEMNFDYNNKSKQSEEKIKVALEAAYAGKGEGNADTEQSKAAKEFISNSSFKLNSSGGTGITGVTSVSAALAQYQKWLDSLPEFPDICKIVDFQNSMVPIWELTDDPNIKSKLQTRFNEYAVQADSMLRELDYKPLFITDIIVVADKNWDKAMAKIPSNYNVVRINPGSENQPELDANKGCGNNTDYIFIAYLMGNDPSKAIAEIGLSEGKNNGLSGMDRIDHDLNSNAGGNYIYLNYRRARANEAPLTAISGYYGNGNTLPDGWQWATNSIDLNHKAHGEFVYLCARH